MTNMPTYHCQACGRRDAWHRDGSTCPALNKGGDFANPAWQTVTWEESPQGKAALAKNPPQRCAYPPRKRKSIDRGLDEESDWEGFECSYLNNIGRGCSTNIFFPIYLLTPISHYPPTLRTRIGRRRASWIRGRI
jgi:hypothetical protein